MRKMLILIPLVLVIESANAQQIDLTDVTGLWGPDTIRTGEPVTFTLSWNNSSPESITSFINCFRVWLTGGSRSPLYVDDVFFRDQAEYCAEMDGWQSIAYRGVDGLGDDTVSFAAWRMFRPGLLPGVICEMVNLTVTVDANAHGESFCLDSSWLPPGDSWVWVGEVSGAFAPTWAGPHCFTVFHCCRGMRGNVDADPADKVNIVDLTNLVAYLFAGGAEPRCQAEADVNADDAVNIADVTYLAVWLMGGGEHSTDPPPEDCP